MEIKINTLIMTELQNITKRMLEIENINMAYNKETNFGTTPNGEEDKIKNLLEEWDELKKERQILKSKN